MITHGSRVHMGGDLRHVGTVYVVGHTNEGTFLNIKWDSGLKSTRVPISDLELADEEPAPQNEIEVLRARLT